MSSHPHFSDGGNLQWHTRFEEAKAAAAREGKLVFIEMGREQCSNCRSLVSAVLPQPSIAKTLKKDFVALSADIDELEDPLRDLLLENMPDAMMLPFVVITDAEGSWLSGSHGALQPADLEKTLAGLVPG